MNNDACVRVRACVAGTVTVKGQPFLVIRKTEDFLHGWVLLEVSSTSPVSEIPAVQREVPKSHGKEE